MTDPAPVTATAPTSTTPATPSSPKSEKKNSSPKKGEKVEVSGDKKATGKAPARLTAKKTNTNEKKNE